MKTIIDSINILNTNNFHTFYDFINIENNHSNSMILFQVTDPIQILLLHLLKVTWFKVFLPNSNSFKHID